MRFVRLASAILLATYCTSCTSYQTLADPVAGLQSSPRPVKKARVTIDTGNRFEVMSPRVLGDSLQGTLRDGVQVSVEMSEVVAVEVRKHNTRRTVLLILGVGAAVPVLFWSIASWVSGGFE